VPSRHSLALSRREVLRLPVPPCAPMMGPFSLVLGLVWLLTPVVPNWLQVRAGIPPVQGFHRDGFRAGMRDCPLIHW
jgi:hypothetical protein